MPEETDIDVVKRGDGTLEFRFGARTVIMSPKQATSVCTKALALAGWSPRRPERPKAVPAPSLELPALFEDPEMQLRYEVRHAYLLTVPISQRTSWPYSEYDILPSFRQDVFNHLGQVSRSQILAAIVDIISGRLVEVKSRRARPLREGGGDDGRLVIKRLDGAVAWRANVSAGTPAARRIMWWRRPNGDIELTRLATHDDLFMPIR